MAKKLKSSDPPPRMVPASRVIAAVVRATGYSRSHLMSFLRTKPEAVRARWIRTRWWVRGPMDAAIKHMSSVVTSSSGPACRLGERYAMRPTYERMSRKLVGMTYSSARARLRKERERERARRKAA